MQPLCLCSCAFLWLSNFLLMLARVVQVRSSEAVTNVANRFNGIGSFAELLAQRADDRLDYITACILLTPDLPNQGCAGDCLVLALVEVEEYLEFHLRQFHALVCEN